MAVTQGPVKNILYSLKQQKYPLLLKVKINPIMGKYSTRARRTVLLSACDVTVDSSPIYAFRFHFFTPCITRFITERLYILHTVYIFVPCM